MHRTRQDLGAATDQGAQRLVRGPRNSSFIRARPPRRSPTPADQASSGHGKLRCRQEMRGSLRLPSHRFRWAAQSKQAASAPAHRAMPPSAAAGVSTRSASHLPFPAQETSRCARCVRLACLAFRPATSRSRSPRRPQDSQPRCRSWAHSRTRMAWATVARPFRWEGEESCTWRSWTRGWPASGSPMSTITVRC